jgi:hypothetical protein
VTIAETTKIDIVATRPDSNVVRLVIADHLEWNDLDTHARLLEEKINTYIAFVESGQLRRLEGHRVPPLPQIWITLAAQHEPPAQAKELLARMESFLESCGLRFEITLDTVGR